MIISQGIGLEAIQAAMLEDEETILEETASWIRNSGGTWEYSIPINGDTDACHWKFQDEHTREEESAALVSIESLLHDLEDDIEDELDDEVNRSSDEENVDTNL